MKRWIVILLAALAAIILLAFGIVLGRHSASASGTASTTSSATGQAEKKVLYWYDPMVPQQHFDKPGLSPMGMQMVPKYAGAAGADPNAVRIDPSTEQNLGMRTVAVKIGTLQRHVRVSGTVAWDLREAQTISARASGVIEHLFVRAPFESVKAGQPLAALISPQWNAAAQEYLALGSAHSPDARALRGAARERLQVLGMDDAQIRALRGGQRQVVLRAPMDGVVSTLDVREGQQVSAGMPLLTVNGLETVWLEAALPQGLGAGITADTPVTASISAVPGMTFHGRVEALLPDVDAMTRTQRARIVLDNAGHRLAPGMFAEVTFAGASGERHPLVPDEALISTGADTRVIVADGDGSFTPVAVTTGLSSDGMVEILRGLKGDERVVVSGQFLIDSEASLSGALQRLDQPASSSSASAMPGTTTTGKKKPMSPSMRGVSRPAKKPKPTSMPGMPMPAASTQEPLR
ncbi:MAG: efflux RND transporter periplasmic adaptor subunit [Pseudomonadota bacterium]|nr:efflux RND transporter periplasmic adaptor subunit [Pseudomonadota bacterium]